MKVKKTEEKQKKGHSGKSASEKHSMGGKSKKSNHIIPHRERRMAGKNWKEFKNLAAANSVGDNANKEKTLKKNLINHHKPKKLISMQDMMDLDKNSADVQEEQTNVTKHLAVDCEMVGIGDGTESMVARVSIVNRYGHCIYDKYVKPREPVSDYRTQVSGIRPHDLQNGEEFSTVQKEVAQILRGRVLVGHALKHDLDVLYLSHPRKLLRDTSQYKPFRQLSQGGTPSLKKLANELLGVDIQTGEHNSIEDARAAMKIYLLHKSQWESQFHSKC